jgi:hypothetical protein
MLWQQQLLLWWGSSNVEHATTSNLQRFKSEGSGQGQWCVMSKVVVCCVSGTGKCVHLSSERHYNIRVQWADVGRTVLAFQHKHISKLSSKHCFPLSSGQHHHSFCHT